jgi:5,5'-dehydrodivanillate O-demethylase
MDQRDVDGNTDEVRVTRQHPDFVFTGPGTLAGRYMRTFWHPVYVGHELPSGRAVPIRILSEDFTLYRGQSGRPQILEFRCAHRANQLSTGWIEGDTIRCRYHGWRYDATGQCVEQPCEREQFCAEIQLRSYPTEEYLGFVFAYLGEGDPPPLPRYEAIEKQSFRVVEQDTRPCNFFNDIDNMLDEAHLHFTHRSRMEAGGVTEYPVNEFEETDFGVVRYGIRSHGTRVGYALMPNLLWVAAPRPDYENRWLDNFIWFVPIDDESHKLFVLNAGDFDEDETRRFHEMHARRAERLRDVPPYDAIGDRILAGEMTVEDAEATGHPKISRIQDHVTQIGQGRIADRRREHLTPLDGGLVLIRRIWERELTALAEGRPLTRWKIPDGIRTMTGLTQTS